MTKLIVPMPYALDKATIELMVSATTFTSNC